MSEHWYTKTGQAAHTQPTKSKGAKNPTRPTTIADAKRLGLLPSVSSILKQAANPALDRWKANQIIKACFNCPPIGDEDLDTYARHILEKADKERDEAANLGTAIHAAIEGFYTGKPYDKALDQYVIPAVEMVDSLGIKIVDQEFVVCSSHGYAGTTDLAFTQDTFCGILDFKSTKTTPDEPVLVKQGHTAQIAAYHVAYWSNDNPINNNTKGYNVYISTTEPGRITVVPYDAATLRREFKYFLSCLNIWQHRYNYDPSGPKVAVEEEGAGSEGGEESRHPGFTD